MIGSAISHYKVIEKIGEGGMGVVYKAQDTKLDRLVALKFLPPQLSSSREDKSRFIQEAKAASALNHPNVCTIHDIQEHQGQMFIVMEFVDGQTLHARMHPAGASSGVHLTEKQAIEIGIQIADGLASAHEKGIVHRDIKPENIMIRKDGIAQIMDFGLAKLRADGTKVTRLTKAGSTVGTAGYMSPEQVQGHEADHRSDIFSLGVVLYELFTGQLPFKGVHETALAYEIVNVDPAPMSTLRPGLDPILDVVVLECVAKEPSERYQSAAEVAKELRRYKRESGRSKISRIVPPAAMSAPKETGPVVQVRRIGMWERVFWSAGMVLAVAVALILYLRKEDGIRTPPLSVRFIVAPPEKSVINQSVVSPDGKNIAFTATGAGVTSLWVRPLTATSAQQLQGTEDALFPFWSPDSRFIGFFAQGLLKKVDLSGGPPIIICDARGAGGTWNRNGDILFGVEDEGLFRVPAAGGVPKPVTHLDSSRNEFSHRWPSFLPDGVHFLFLALQAFDESMSIFLASLEDTTRTFVLTADVNAIATSSGDILFLRNRTLMSQPFSLSKKSLEGEPRPIAVDVGWVPRLALGDFSYSAAGVTTFGGGRSVNRQYGWFDRDGKQIGSAAPPGNYFDIALTRSGTHAAVQKVDVQTGNSDIWVIDIARDLISRFTFEPAVEDDPVWSADGKYVYYSNTKEGTYNVYRKMISGNTAPERVTKPGPSQRPVSVSADGKLLLIERVQTNTKEDIWVLPLHEGAEPVPYLTSEFSETFAQFSPDGRWIAYVSDESGKREVYVQSYPISGGRWQISTRGGSQPRWRQDGKELYYISYDLELIAVEIRASETFDIGTSRPLFQTRIDSYSSPNRYEVADNGKKFLINVPIGNEQVSPITVIINPNE